MRGIYAGTAGTVLELVEFLPCFVASDRLVRVVFLGWLPRGVHSGVCLSLRLSGSYQVIGSILCT